MVCWLRKLDIGSAICERTAEGLLAGVGALALSGTGWRYVGPSWSDCLLYWRFPGYLMVMGRRQDDYDTPLFSIFSSALAG